MMKCILQASALGLSLMLALGAAAFSATGPDPVRPRTAVRRSPPRQTRKHHAGARRVQPRRTPAHSCQANLRKIGSAMRAYLLHSGGRLPPAERWAEALAPYVKESAVWHCPQHSPRAYSYAINRRVAGHSAHDDGIWGHVLLFESTAGRRSAADEGESLCSPGRHNGGGYYLFVDGRVEWRKSKPSF